ncbi:MAG: tyrosine--tRNA ligase [Alphaproteobacteria bacterium]|nr:tyrosine--tRNA ligase [Alphaproteobacteria bacterium]
MTMPSSDFLQRLQERGFVHQCTDLAALDERARAGRIVAYIGFDCTAPSLHVGSLVQIMLLRHLQQSGHKPIVLMGGGTTKVGDPTGRDESRKLLSEAEIAANMAGIQRIFAKYLTFGEGPADAVMVNNADWLDRLEYIGFLREYGRHFSVNRMLSFDSVKLRLEREQPMTFLEFNYMILQAYDFVELHRRHGCVLQMGGSDQWGNIVNGVELGRRVADASLFGLTSHLITTASGAKMGKTAQGAVWLNAEQLAPFDYWQFWRNTEDRDVGRFLRLFTELPLDEIARLERLEGQELNEAKKLLATEATALCHGRAAAEDAAALARRTFEAPAGREDLGAVAGGWKRVEIETAAFPLARAMVEAQVSANNSIAKNLIRDGQVRVHGEVVTDPSYRFDEQGFTRFGFIPVEVGKKAKFSVYLAARQGG